MSEKPAVETAYRNDEPILEARIGPLLVKRDAAREDIADVLSVVHRRNARILAGRFGLAGANATVVVALVQVAIKRGSWQGSGLLTLLLLGSAAVSVIVYLVLAADPLHRIAARLAAFTARTRDLRGDVERLASDRDLWSLREEAARLERRSVFSPLAAIALLMPLVVHFFCGLLISVIVDSSGYATFFDAWIVMSIGLVGAAHISLVYRSARLATLLGKTPDALLSSVSLGYGWRTLGWITLYACLPGAILWLVPVVLAAVTGAFIVPLLFLRIGKLIARERALIGLPPVE